MSSSFKKLKKKRMIADKRNSHFCSTPVEGARRPSSISVSAVDTNSSSSTRGQGKPQVIQKVPLKKRIKKRKQLTRELERKEKKNEEKERQKTKKKKKKKKKTPTLQVDSDKDWETYDETFRQPSFKVVTSGSGNDVLFKSPERVREAPRFIDDHLESSPFPFRRQEVESPKRISFTEEEGTLPLKELPFCSNIYYFDTDEEEDSLKLRRERTIKTYLGLRPTKPRGNDLRIEKCKEWLVDVPIPTASSNLLWDDFVKNNHKTISKYLASPNNDRKKSLLTRRHRQRNNETDDEDDENEAAEEWYNVNSVVTESGKKMAVACGHCDKYSRKWVRYNDVYNFPERDDDDRDVKDETRERITLNQFLEKCRAKKTKGELGSSSSSPIYQQSTENNLKDFRKNLVKKKKRKKRFRENSESDTKMSKREMANVTESELQRIREVRKFASRLNAKEKTINYNEISLATTSKNNTSDLRVSSLKRVNTRGTDDRKDNCKRRKQIDTKSKPKIKAVTSLISVRFVKGKQQWRITNAI